MTVTPATAKISKVATLHPDDYRKDQRVTSPKDWLDRLRNKPVTEPTWAEYRRNEALELLANANGSGTWIELSTHYNGFVREVAVRELSCDCSPQALVALIERLNDWVPQIRDLALSGLNNYLNPAQAPALLYALESIMALAARQRVDHAPTYTAARTVLQSPDIRDEVFANFLTRQGKAARYLFSLLLETDFDLERLLRSALAHRELTVRLAAVSVCQDLPPAQASPLLLEALARPGAKVRVNILRALLPLSDDPVHLLRLALLDPSPAIRSLARWAAPRHGVDASEVLAQRLSLDFPTRKREWLGVLGLAAELEIRLQKHWLTEALSSIFPSVRQAAVRLLGDEDLPQMLGALSDPSEKVYLAAYALSDKQPWAVLNTGVAAKLECEWHDLPPQRSWAILRLMSNWQQIAYLLKRLEAEPVVETFWLRQVDLWCDRQYQVVDPVTSKDQRSALVQQLRALAASGLIQSPKVALFTD
jgi:HEAT repeat protein